MSKRKGLDIEDKKRIILKVLRKQKEPFALPDLEALCSEEGLAKKDVKPLLKELETEENVKSDKIGVTMFYWSFPSDSAITKQREISELTEAIESKTVILKQYKQTEKELLKDRKQTEERKEKIQLLKDLAKEKEDQTQTLCLREGCSV